MKKLLILLLLVSSVFTASAQEFLCQVSVSSSQVQSTDRSVYEDLQKTLYEFINNKKWTSYNFKAEEKIECNLMIIINNRSGDKFSGTMSVQCRRPVYHTSYYSTLLNYIDKDIEFEYLEGKNIEFIENTHSDNLSALVAYYLNIFLGLDFDTFSQNGGTPFYQKAQSIVSAAQNAPEKGWKSYESMKNRYWLVENLTNSSYSGIREGMYKYHREGLDNMTENMEIGRAAIMESLESFRKAFREKPGLYLMQLVMDAKSDEMVNIFSQASPMDKTRAMNLLKEIDAANGNKYQKIVESK
ncbi:MAG: DUF4835 family protein [Bacteroidota bacterium]